MVWLLKCGLIRRPSLLKPPILSKEVWVYDFEIIIPMKPKTTNTPKGTAISVAPKLALGIGLLLTPSQISRCQDLSYSQENPEECKKGK